MANAGSGNRFRRAVFKFLLFVSASLVVALSFCQIIIWIEPRAPNLAVLEQLAMPLAALAIAAGVLAVAGRNWRVALLSGVLFVTLSWPVYPRTQPAAVSGDQIRFVTMNLWVKANGGDRAIKSLEESDADLIGLSEVNGAWQQKLTPLFAQYPYRVDCFDLGPACDIVLLSRVPILQRFSGRISGARPFVVGGEIEWKGKHLVVVATHLTQPFAPSDPAADLSPLAGSLPQNLQTVEAANLARFANQLRPDLVLLGDLNCVPWSRTSRAFRAATGLGSSAENVASWPSFVRWPLALPIDYVLARGHPVVTSLRALEATESDHRAIMAEIGWRD